LHRRQAEMPFDLTGLFEAIWSSLRVIPPPVIGIVLLGSPTAALMGYRMIVAGRRRAEAPAAAALWVCRDCRSVNHLGLSRCYRCGLEQDATGEIEFIVDQPASRPAPFEVPAGSPFAAVAEIQHRPGIPVMADRVSDADPVAVGPGRNAGAQAPATSAEDEPVAIVEVDT
jgi:hypothetical protein